ncbi:MAG: two-component system regulatory protein YycI [Paenibacillaceae bacterium]
MDWSRAKMVLILSFLILNLLLGYQMWATRWDPRLLNSDMSAFKEETKQLLTSKNIKVLITIPKAVPKLRQISVKFADNNGDPKLIVLPDPIAYTNFTAKNSLRDLAFKADIPNASQYQLDRSVKQANLYIFNQMFEDIPMFDITLQLIVGKGTITGYKQTFVEVQSGIEQKEQKVISAYTAVRSLAENYLPTGSVITDIQLGYHGQRFDSQTQPMLPFWRIVLAQGTSYYVQAFSGAVEGNQEQTKN